MWLLGGNVVATDSTSLLRAEADNVNAYSVSLERLPAGSPGTNITVEVARDSATLQSGPLFKLPISSDTLSAALKAAGASGTVAGR